MTPTGTRTGTACRTSSTTATWVPNPDQSDVDGDKAGDACDAPPAGTWSTFTGFRPPVDDFPTLNAVEAGSAIPVPRFWFD